MAETNFDKLLKIKKTARESRRVSGYSNWESIQLIKSSLTTDQLELFKSTCFGHFLNVNEMVFSGYFCHHILLRECHIQHENESIDTMWFHIGNDLIRYSPIEFCLVTGLQFGDSSKFEMEESHTNNQKLRQKYFSMNKVTVAMVVDWFKSRLWVDKNISDMDMVKLALVLFLEMTLCGTDKRNAIQYWALQLVDDLDAFNKFPWGSFIHHRSYKYLSSYLKDAFDSSGKGKGKGSKINLYGFVTAFQVWAIEAIPMWSTLGHARRVNNSTPRILNWICIGTPGYDSLQNNLFDKMDISINSFVAFNFFIVHFQSFIHVDCFFLFDVAHPYKVLSPFDDEAKKLYWESLSSWIVLNDIKFRSHSGCFDDDV